MYMYGGSKDIIQATRIAGFGIYIDDNFASIWNLHVVPKSPRILQGFPHLFFIEKSMCTVMLLLEKQDVAE